MVDEDRFARVERAVARVQDELDEAVEDTRHAGSKTATEVREPSTSSRTGYRGCEIGSESVPPYGVLTQDRTVSGPPRGSGFARA